MELKEYIKILKINFKLFLVIVILVIAGSLLYFSSRPVSYNASLFLNVTRRGFQETQDFRYDDFYRLQADEKFSETVVEWLKSPRVVTDIYAEAGYKSLNLDLEQLSKYLSAEKRSSQIVAVNFSALSQESAKKISDGIVKVISRNIENLNRDQKENTWFKIIANDPVILKNNPDYGIIFLASFLAGLFLAFWIVMIKYYLEL